MQNKEGGEHLSNTENEQEATYAATAISGPAPANPSSDRCFSLGVVDSRLGVRLFAMGALTD